ncbi:MAG: GNAT family N-acetyltransferase [Pseudomonadota bacterium]
MSTDQESRGDCDKPSLTLRQAAGPDDMTATRELFMSYAKSLGFKTCFQGFDKEIESLPGEYAPPKGRLLLAERDGDILGVIALRSMGEGGACEIKRLYVEPGARGMALGRRLTEAVLGEARDLGCRSVRLETLPSMVAANVIYDDLGFEVIASDNAPSPDVITKELRL